MTQSMHRPAEQDPGTGVVDEARVIRLDDLDPPAQDGPHHDPSDPGADPGADAWADAGAQMARPRVTGEPRTSLRPPRWRSRSWVW